MKYGSYKQYLRHPVFLIIRKQVMDRNSGICEVCDENKATEVHHHQNKPDRYPPWGTFDAPSKMKAVCHECHCKEHGVKQ